MLFVDSHCYHLPVRQYLIDNDKYLRDDSLKSENRRKQISAATLPCVCRSTNSLGPLNSSVATGEKRCRTLPGIISRNSEFRSDQWREEEDMLAERFESKSRNRLLRHEENWNGRFTIALRTLSIQVVVRLMLAYSRFFEIQESSV